MNEILNITTIVPSIIGGLIIGSIVFNAFNFKFSNVYSMSICVVVFIFLMATTEFTRSPEEAAGWFHWISAIALYFLFIISALIGQRFKRAALFFNLL